MGTPTEIKPTEIKMKVVVDTSDVVRATEAIKEYIRLKSIAGLDTSSDLAAMAAITQEMIGEQKNLPEAGDGNRGGRGAGDLFADEDRGWQRLSFPTSPPFPDY
jgi:hypothetical protein